MADDYAGYLAGRAHAADQHGFEPTWIPDWLYGFQQALTGWAVRQGRAGLFEDCGLGKTVQELVWAVNVQAATGRPVLIVTPLAVTFQIAAEAARFGVDAGISRDGSAVAPVTITNYDRLDRFDRAVFGGVVCDESSAIKAFDGQRRALVTDFCRKIRYRLLATATAAPNDYTELGTSSEALGYLGHVDMLNRFFTNKGHTSDTRGQWKPAQLKSRNGVQVRAFTQPGWRFKGHGEDPFWRWVASWARACRRPSDLGFPDDGYVLPELVYRRHVVTPAAAADGTLFDVPAAGLREFRDEQRRTLAERCEMAAGLLADAGRAVAWCHLNDEGDLLEKLTGGVQVAGSDPAEVKEEKLAAFSRGEIRVLVTKPKIGAWGLNWQHCHRMTYFPDWSFEAHYQAVRRCWRFGQAHPVTVDVVTTPGGLGAMEALGRKAAQADLMFTALTGHMRDAQAAAPGPAYDRPLEVPSWAR